MEAGDDLRVGPGVVVPGSELSWRFSRSSGAGGQHVNTTDSRVELSWNVAATAALSETQRERALRKLNTVDGVITVAASERRSQLRNRQAARQRMAELIAEAIAPPPPPRRPTKPTKASQRRRVEGKIRRGEIKRLRQRPDE